MVPPYKYIVVGGGTAGCLTAFMLSSQMQERKIPGRVLLIDAGDGAHKNQSPIMAKWFENWANYSVAHETFAENNVYLPAPGTTHIGLGGASSHDTRITFVPTKRWQREVEQKMRWEPNELAAYFQLALNMIPINSAGDGERFYDAVLSTLAKTKTLTVPPDRHFNTQIAPNSAAYVSVAMFPNETRWMSAWLLDDPVRPANLDILTMAPVKRVIFNPNETGTPRAVGVELTSGVTVELETDKKNESLPSEVILTAGAIRCPEILQRSGIGPMSALRRMNINPVKSIEAVGHGIDHIEAPVQYEWLPSWNEAKDDNPPRGGPMSWPLVFFLNGTNILAHFGLAAPPYGEGNVVMTPNRTEPCTRTGFHAQLDRTTDAIRVIHVESHEDFKILATGVREAIRVMDVLQSQGLVGRRVQPTDQDLLNDATLDSWIRSNTGTAFHWQGTCRAGNDEDSVVDEHFRVRGVSGLRVGSAACIPQPTEANPHLTIGALSIALAYDVLRIKPPNSMFVDMPVPLKPGAKLMPDTSICVENYWKQNSPAPKVEE